MGLEIERKFLIDHDKWAQLKKPVAKHYRQGYILADNQRTVRIRVDDKKAYLNLKAAHSKITRKEFEYQIPVNEGIEILKELAQSSIEKKRYKIKFAGNIWEVDEFLGDNKGLIVAEIELKNEADEFKKPEWVTQDVTHDKKYANSSLSTHPFKDW